MKKTEKDKIDVNSDKKENNIKKEVNDKKIITIENLDQNASKKTESSNSIGKSNNEVSNKKD